MVRSAKVLKTIKRARLSQGVYTAQINVAAANGNNTPDLLHPGLLAGGRQRCRVPVTSAKQQSLRAVIKTCHSLALG